MSGRVSVVVPTRNSSATLARCLRSVREQSHPDVEIVVVDNSSSDDTLGVAGELADVVLTAGPERSAQRNRGAGAATGDLLFFIDSDMSLERDVVAEAVAEVSAGATSVVVPERSYGTGFWTAVKALERDCYLGDPTIEAARFVPRAEFDAIGGYDEEIVAGPEDWDLHARLQDRGGRLGRTRSLIWHDEGRLRLRETMATKYYYGRSTAVYLRKHPELARGQLTVARPAFLREWRTLAARPQLGAALVVMKVLELSAGAAGLIAARLRG